MLGLPCSGRGRSPHAFDRDDRFAILTASILRLPAGFGSSDAWLLAQRLAPENATAPQAAGVIHTDFERGFIRAEVIAYDDFIRYHGEAGAKEAGKWRLEGKDYRVQEGDVIHFRFNV